MDVCASLSAGLLLANVITIAPSCLRLHNNVTDDSFTLVSVRGLAASRFGIGDLSWSQFVPRLRPRSKEEING